MEPPPAGHRWTDKSAARAWVRGGLAALDPTLLAGISRETAANVIEFLRGRNNLEGARLMAFVPFRREIDPIMVASSVMSAGGSVCIARCREQGSVIEPLLLPPAAVQAGGWHLVDANPDAWGTPIPRDATPVPAASISAVLVPGLAFDRHGGRLGRGAGIYDRFLATLPAATLRIGLIPSAFLVERLPTDPHDVPMHAVATERELIVTAR
jgi:5-formyltetrahydrofolate cyclo-ligase